MCSEPWSTEFRGGRQTLTISQDTSRVTVREADAALERTFAFNLDGSESSNETRSVTNEKWTFVSRARWVSAALLVTNIITRESIGRPWESMTVYFLSPDGSLKVITVDSVTMPGPFMSSRTMTYARR